MDLSLQDVPNFAQVFPLPLASFGEPGGTINDENALCENRNLPAHENPNPGTQGGELKMVIHEFGRKFLEECRDVGEKYGGLSPPPPHFVLENDPAYAQPESSDAGGCESEENDVILCGERRAEKHPHSHPTPATCISQQMCRRVREVTRGPWGVTKEAEEVVH